MSDDWIITGIIACGVLLFVVLMSIGTAIEHDETLRCQNHSMEWTHSPGRSAHGFCVLRSTGQIYEVPSD